MGAASRHATRDINAVNALQTEEATRIVSQPGTDKSGDMLRYVHPSLLVRRRWCVPNGVQVQLGWRSTSMLPCLHGRSERESNNEQFILLSVYSMCWWQQSRRSATSVTKECNAGRRAARSSQTALRRCVVWESFSWERSSVHTFREYMSRSEAAQRKWGAAPMTFA